MTTMQPKYYGWYSKKQHEWMKEWIQKSRGKTDCHLYLNMEGEEVVCTEVTQIKGSVEECRPSTSKNYNDMYFVGKMTKWLGNGVRPLIENQIFV